MPEDDQLRIVKVELTPQSMKSWREIHEQHPIFYPVLLRLSRQLDDFERHAMTLLEPTLIIGNDQATILLAETTLEAAHEQIPGFTERINSAAAQGRQARDAALEEDAQMFAVEAELNDKLRNSDN